MDLWTEWPCSSFQGLSEIYMPYKLAEPTKVPGKDWSLAWSPRINPGHLPWSLRWNDFYPELYPNPPALASRGQLHHLYLFDTEGGTVPALV